MPSVLHFEVFVDAVVRAFAAQARRLDAAERRHFGRDDAGVDADHAVFERFGDAEDAADVFCVEVRGEAELGVVGHADGFGFVGLEAEQRGDRAEGFFAWPCGRCGRTSASMVGSKKLPPSAWRLPPVMMRAPLAVASAMCSSTLATAPASISGPW
jgi:hypothetical protein